jgi:hypothetical protein
MLSMNTRSVAIALAAAALALLGAQASSGSSVPRVTAANTTLAADDQGSMSRNGRIAITSNRDGNNEIYTMEADGSDRLNLTRNPADDRSSKWSPDGTRIVFASDRDGNFEIYAMDADGSDVTRLTSNDAFDNRPAWTADGQHIVFQSLRDGNFEIYRMNIDGSEQTNLTTNAADDRFPATSPKGGRVAFYSDRSGSGDIYMMKLSGGVPRQVTSGPPMDFEPDWSPAGNDLVFLRDTTGVDNDIYSVHADGTGETRITNSASRAEFDPAWSPDGGKLVFTGCTEAGTPAQHCSSFVMNANGSGEIEISTPRAPLGDDFDDNFRDPFWHVIQDPGASINETNGHLEISIAGSAEPGGPFNQVDAHYGSNCSLPSDFDMQVDYSLLEWPPANGVFAPLSAFFIGAFVSRHSDPFAGDRYTAFSDPVFIGATTTDLTGSFRLVRSGNSLNAYYKSAGGAWVQLLSAPANPGDAVIGLGLSAIADQWAHQTASVAYDNFQLTSGSLSCPTWWADTQPDWQPLARG